MTTLVQKLVNEGVVICPKCKTPGLALVPQGYQCTRCLRVWPSHWSVPDFFCSYVERPGDPDAVASADLVDRVCDALALGRDAATTAAVSQILGRASRLHTDNASLTAEIADIQDRFFGGQEYAHPPTSANANKALSAEFERHYFPTSVASAECFSANVRVRNDGVHDWSSRTGKPAVLKAQWRGWFGKSTVAHFPVDIPPGRAITVPIKLEAPAKAGMTRVRISLECVGSRERARRHLDIPIEVRAARGEGESVDGVRYGPAIPDYAEDHKDALNFLMQHIEKMGKPPRMLEVGSGPHPQLAWLDGSELVAIDISAPLLELGSLYFGERFAHRLAFICADAFDPPFAHGAFDLVGMFSALHHFPEPEILLERLSRLLRPGGMLAVMCEPVDDRLDAAPTVRDLLKGINEQVFSVPEYLRIFASAGLAVTEVKVDGGSLKAILRKG